MKEVLFNGERCKVWRIVNSNVCIETSKGIRFVHVSKVKFVEAEEDKADDLDGMTKAQLVQYAADKGIDIDKKKKKADMIAEILKAGE